MPEPTPHPKLRPHPWRRTAPEIDPSRSAHPDDAPYAELHVTSNFTFLTGASDPDEFVEQAAALNLRAVAVTDVNTLAGVVRAHVAAKQHGVDFLVGARIEMQPCTTVPATWSILLYPTDRASYGRLSTLITVGRRRAPKGECFLTLDDVLDHHDGLLAIAVPPHPLPDWFADRALPALRRAFDDDRLSVALSRRYDADDDDRLVDIADAAARHRIPLVATNDVHYHIPERRPLQDVLTCIRHGCTLDEAGLRLFPHAERGLKSGAAMTALFDEYPDAVARTLDIARRAAGFSLDEIRYQYPSEICPAGVAPMDHLRTLTWAGARERFGAHLDDKVRRKLEHELDLIESLEYAPYFLTVHDLVRFARSRGILCQGRGAAANSAVCYCLGVTSVDPERIDLLFERFVSQERDEPPDIDIDFEHERREEVIQYIYRKYGRHRAALTAVVITYRARSAVRDIGKALGLSLDGVDRLAKSMDWWDRGGIDPERLAELGLNPDDPTLRRLAILMHQIRGFPRHLSQHVGGFVITEGPLHDLVPIQNAAMDDRTVIEWDKDDVDAMGMLKVDVLGLGMLSCIRRAFEFVEQHHDRTCTLANIPEGDEDVYDMICRADTVGVFQIESRAQMSMLPRLRPRNYYDLVIEVAIVRPGPIQGDMVHPYLRRRDGMETATYPSPEVERVLGKTLGVPLFQEQAMSLAIVAAGFTPGEADLLRRAIAAWKSRPDAILEFRDKLVAGMMNHGYDQDFAERCFRQIQGFSGYGFPESHAASFALLVYVSCYLKHHYPAAFAAALVNSQPMGFYAPAQIIRDAREHGVEIRSIDVNESRWDCTLEDHPVERERPSLRLGLRLVKGLSEEDAQAIVEARDRLGARFESIDHLHRISGVKVAALRRLAYADAFTSLGVDRQAALWRIRSLRDDPRPLIDRALLDRPDAAAELESHGQMHLPFIPESRKVVHDYASTGLSLRGHPLAFIRPTLDQHNVTPAENLRDPHRCAHGRFVSVAGVVLVRQRPGTAKGVIFMTIEDETGVANLIFWSDVFKNHRRTARHSTMLLAHGRIERAGDVVHVLVQRVESLDTLHADTLTVKARNFH